VNLKIARFSLSFALLYSESSAFWISSYRNRYFEEYSCSDMLGKLAKVRLVVF
jgi:hypothetical protein